jgi:predicted nucleotidyltransferase
MKRKLLLRENEKKALIELKDELSKNFKLKELRLFGSKVRGDFSRESDIDVMIEVDYLDSKVKNQIYDIVFDINLSHETLLSLTIFNKDEIENGPMSESPIYKIIQKEGIVI